MLRHWHCDCDLHDEIRNMDPGVKGDWLNYDGNCEYFVKGGGFLGAYRVECHEIS